MEKLREILEDLHEEYDYETCTTLIDDKLLDSLDIVTLISEIYSEFDVDVPPEEMIPENFNSMQAIYDMIQRLKD